MVSNLQDFIPILMQIIFAFAFTFLTIIASKFLGPSRKNKRKDANFECGIEPIGNARSPFPIKYFVVALLFVLFDIEIVFMYPWAINFKSLGVDAFWKMGIFIGLLFVGYLYINKRKALDWDK